MFDDNVKLIRVFKLMEISGRKKLENYIIKLCTIALNYNTLIEGFYSTLIIYTKKYSR